MNSDPNEPWIVIWISNIKPVSDKVRRYDDLEWTVVLGTTEGDETTANRDAREHERHGARKERRQRPEGWHIPGGE